MFAVQAWLGDERGWVIVLETDDYMVASRSKNGLIAAGKMARVAELADYAFEADAR